MNTPAWFRRARRSQSALLFVVVATPLVVREMPGEPLWGQVLVGAFAWSLYFGAWALADVVVSHGSAS